MKYTVYRDEPRTWRNAEFAELAMVQCESTTPEICVRLRNALNNQWLPAQMLTPNEAVQLMHALGVAVEICNTP